MSVAYWNGSTGSFRQARNWSQAAPPTTGDALYASSGNMTLNGGTFGATATRTTIGLMGSSASDAPSLVLRNVTLTNVTVSEAPPPYAGPYNDAPPGYYSPKYGNLLIAGVVTNDGGLIEGGRNSLGPAASLNIVMATGATLLNKGTLAAYPAGQLTIAGHGPATVENDGAINATGGKVTISTHLTGVGNIYTSTAGGGGFSGSVELNAAVDAGQTFHISQGSLQIDQPRSFLGLVDLGPAQLGGTVRLESLNAASWDAKGTLLELFNAAGKAIDTLQFTSPPTATMLAVSNIPDATYGHAVSIVSHPFGSPATGANVLPYHNA